MMRSPSGSRPSCDSPANLPMISAAVRLRLNPVAGRAERAVERQPILLEMQAPAPARNEHGLIPLGPGRPGHADRHSAFHRSRSSRRRFPAPELPRVGELPLKSFARSVMRAKSVRRGVDPFQSALARILLARRATTPRLGTSHPTDGAFGPRHGVRLSACGESSVSAKKYRDSARGSLAPPSVHDFFLDVLAMSRGRSAPLYRSVAP